MIICTKSLEIKVVLVFTSNKEAKIIDFCILFNVPLENISLI